MINKSLGGLTYWFKDTERKQFDKTEELVKEFIEESKQRRKLRELFSERIFWFAVAWAGFLVAVLLMEAFNWHLFHLDYRVLVALIAGTSAGIIGLLAAVVKYIFPEK